MTHPRTIDPRVSKARDWKRIERLPDNPDAAVMTSTGYWLRGRFYPSGAGR